MLGDLDLLLLRRLISRRRILRATVAGPGLGAELESALVAIARVDLPVTAGLAGRDLIPLLDGCRVRRWAAHQWRSYESRGAAAVVARRARFFLTEVAAVVILAAVVFAEAFVVNSDLCIVINHSCSS